MVYADYEYYKNKYQGTAIPEFVFNKVSRIASVHIDCFTFNRITGGSVSNYASLSDCACHMAEEIYSVTGDSGIDKEKRSESTDGYSVSYVTGSDGNTEAEMRKKLYSIAELYLSGTGLLYAGC